MLEQLGWLVTGLVLVALGADSLVRALAGFALGAKASRFAVGLVVVAFGASLPELSVGARALGEGARELALGNVVGSNLANLGLVLGVAALAAPVNVSMRWLHAALPALMVSALLLIGLGYDGRYGGIDAVVLLAAFTLLLVHAFTAARREAPEVQAELATAADTQTAAWRNALRLVLGLVALWYGTGIAVDAARAFGPEAGWSDLVTGLTLVAVGNAIPELALLVVAARRGYGNVVAAGVVGASLVNALLVVGAGAAAGGLPVAASLVKLELPAMLAFSVALYPMVRGDSTVSRREGAILVLAWLALFAWQVVRATT
jgi:cation:H+ antiporter